MGGRKRRNRGQSSAQRGRNPDYRNPGGNRYRNHQHSNRQQFDDTYAEAQHLAFSNSHNKNNYYDPQYIDDHGHNGNHNGGRRRNKKNNHRNNNNNKGKGTWKPKGSGKKSELGQFLDQLRPLGLGIRKAQSDGNCLFRAISDQISGDQNNQAKYRKNIVEYMKANNDEFAPF